MPKNLRNLRWDEDSLSVDADRWSQVQRVHGGLRRSLQLQSPNIFGKCPGPGSGVGFPNDEKQAGDGRLCRCDCERDSLAPSPFAMSGLKGPLIASETALGGEGQVCLPFRQFQPPSGWVWLDRVRHSCVGVDPCCREPSPCTICEDGRVGGSGCSRDHLAAPHQRRDACAGNAAGGDEYNTPLHVGALIIILAVSSLACAIPMLAAKFPVLRIPEPFFFAVRHIGTGVLLATAFVHLLPTAFISLGNPCLSNFWTTDYPAMPGAIALVGIFFVSIIEMIFSPARNFTPRTGRAGAVGGGGSAGASGAGAHTAHASMGGGHCSNAAVVAAITRPSATHHASLELAPLEGSAAAGTSPNLKEALGTESQGWSLTPEQRHKKAILQSYGCTTPIGQAIGLATHTLYSPDSEFGLILVGTMNAVSSGLLVFAALIELLAEDFLSDESWSVLRGRRRVMACLLVLFGAICMSLVGAWA
ncbi:hypothetical protein CHGG_05470 [Chaetomium globosum CBS 148.51]|uniref:Uncharacterized protein n=1 Tax=Chaetomium globosum (strain ATCC 6205 / CBS 148.51 / DSM 1962 / NBRC 6347 / NRRL 1970) TaxID=306901 RepID=Q2H795_CHAGB|nr:uncharacterized protein CHGG_05470 [Chaetomium globosum CBS 148.51]EAQ88851.1 hypothetical protein CHGG_05470 [Chaetomium globosum CBS 148.51]